MAGIRWGAFTCVGWQVTLCDPIWQVTSRSSEMRFPGRAISAFYLFALLGLTHNCLFHAFLSLRMHFSAPQRQKNSELQRLRPALIGGTHDTLPDLLIGWEPFLYGATPLPYLKVILPSRSKCALKFSASRRVCGQLDLTRSNSRKNVWFSCTIIIIIIIISVQKRTATRKKRRRSILTLLRVATTHSRRSQYSLRHRSRQLHTKIQDPMIKGLIIGRSGTPQSLENHITSSGPLRV